MVLAIISVVGILCVFAVVIHLLRREEPAAKTESEVDEQSNPIQETIKEPTMIIPGPSTLSDVVNALKDSKILVVEDTPRNLRSEALEFLLTLTSSPIAVAKTLDSALAAIDGVDIILTDLFFPSKEGGVAELNGLKVVEKALSKGKKVGICSDFSHHQKECSKLLYELEEKFKKENGGNVLFIEGRSTRAGYEGENGDFTADEDGDWLGDGSGLVKDWGKLLVNLIIHSPVGWETRSLYRDRSSIPK